MTAHSDDPKWSGADKLEQLQAEGRAMRQMRQDQREYRYERKRLEAVEIRKSGGGAKERARRLKRLGQANVDLRGVPSPQEGPGEGADGESLLRLEPGSPHGEVQE